MKEFSFKVPQNIVFGEGSIRKLPELLKEKRLYKCIDHFRPASSKDGKGR